MSQNQTPEMPAEVSVRLQTAETSATPRAWAYRTRVVLGVIGVTLAVFCLLAAWWVRRTFGVIAFEQLLMNLPAGGGAGVTEAESVYVSNFVWTVVTPALVVLAGLSLAAMFWLRAAARTSRPARMRIRPVSWAVVGAGAVVLCVSGGLLAQTVGVQAYLRSLNSPLTMSDYYVEPDTVLSSQATTAALKSRAAEPEKPLNLITIYLESTEDSFADSSQHGANLLKPVTDATADWERIPELLTYSSGGWTMGGIVGTQCGVPLRGASKVTDNQNANEIGESTSSYMPDAVCLGDVLHDAGYHSVFMGGADESFASKESFLTSHGYDEVLGLSHWIERDAQPLSDWGLSDRTLLDEAAEKLRELRTSEVPYHLSVLTLDFHEPLHVFDYCEDEAAAAEVPMAAVLTCSMTQVAEFLDTIEKMGVLEDTVVVLMGDHPKMLAEGGAFWDQLARLDTSERPLFNRIWSPNDVTVKQQSADQLSMYATTLDLLGLIGEDTRAGMGVSVVDETIHPLSALTLDPYTYDELIRSRSADLYRQLWGATTS